MFDKEIEMAEIQSKLREKFRDDFWTEVSDDNADKLVLRMRMMNLTATYPTDAAGNVIENENGTTPHPRFS